MTKKVYKTITEETELGETFFDGTIGQLHLAINQLLEEYGEDAVVHLDAWGDYLTINIHWQRQETDEERGKRLARAKKSRETRKKHKMDDLERELKEYKRLKKKWEGRDA